MTSYEEQLIELVRGDDRIMGLLRTVRSLEIDQWCIAAGTIRNKVWDHLHGFAEPTLPSDIDVLIYDSSQTAPAHEAALEAQLHDLVPEVRWEVVNQATIHTYVGDASPYTSIEQAMSRWADLVTAVGVQLTADDRLHVIAPAGLDDLFNLRVRPNLITPTSMEVYRDRMANKGWLTTWPLLHIDKAPS